MIHGKNFSDRQDRTSERIIGAPASQRHVIVEYARQSSQKYLEATWSNGFLYSRFSGLWFC